MLDWYFAGPASASVLLSGSGGCGFLATVENMISRLKAGKAFVSCGDDETLNQPSPVSGVVGTTPMPAATHVACASVGGRILTFPIEQLNAMAARGRKGKVADLGFKPNNVTRVL